MDSLTDADIAELKKLEKDLSKPHLPVHIEYEPESRHVVVRFKKPSSSGLSDAEHSLPLSRYSTFDKLKTDIKRYAGG